MTDPIEVRAAYTAADRRDWPAVFGAALVLVVLLPGGCGVAAGMFVWAFRAIAGWP